MQAHLCQHQVQPQQITLKKKKESQDMAVLFPYPDNIVFFFCLKGL